MSGPKYLRVVPSFWSGPMSKDRMHSRLTGIVMQRRKLHQIPVDGTINENTTSPDWYDYYIRVSGREFSVSKEEYNRVSQGETVTVTLETRWWLKWFSPVRSISPVISKTETYEPKLPSTKPQEPAPSVAEELQLDEQLCVFLGSFGVDAHVLEQHPFTAEPTADGEDVWIETAAGAMRWVRCPIFSDGMYFYVPDDRIEPDFPQIMMARGSIKWVPLLGPDRPMPVPLSHELSRLFADQLNSNPAANVIFGGWEIPDVNLRVVTVPWWACWEIFYEFPMDLEDPLNHWDAYQALAGALLAMPIPVA